MKSTLLLTALLATGACLANATPEAKRSDERTHSEQTNPSAIAEEPVQAPERVVCERKKRVGSNLVERVCKTESQRQAARERAREDLQRLGGCSGNEGPCDRSL